MALQTLVCASKSEALNSYRIERDARGCTRFSQNDKGHLQPRLTTQDPALHRQIEDVSPPAAHRHQASLADCTLLLVACLRLAVCVPGKSSSLCLVLEVSKSSCNGQSSLEFVRRCGDLSESKSVINLKMEIDNRTKIVNCVDFTWDGICSVRDCPVPRDMYT